jgi:hypothetical protein
MRTDSEADHSPPSSYKCVALSSHSSLCLHVVILIYAQEQFHIYKAFPTEFTKQTLLLHTFQILQSTFQTNDGTLPQIKPHPLPLPFQFLIHIIQSLYDTLPYYRCHYINNKHKYIKLRGEQFLD